MTRHGGYRHGLAGAIWLRLALTQTEIDAVMAARLEGESRPETLRRLVLRALGVQS